MNMHIYVFFLNTPWNRNVYFKFFIFFLFFRWSLYYYWLSKDYYCADVFISVIKRLKVKVFFFKFWKDRKEMSFVYLILKKKYLDIWTKLSAATFIILKSKTKWDNLRHLWAYIRFENSLRLSFHLLLYNLKFQMV